MRNLNRLPLDDDIIDRILQFSPSFPTLQSAILTSKAFYNVFKAHPRSLIRAVAYNIVGPALPQALRAVRYRVPEGNDKKDDSGSETESDSDDEHRDKAPPRSPKNASPSVEDDDEEDEETDEKILITPEEIRQLTENAKVVAELQELLSLRHKNRKFKTSQLTPTESYSFQRAVYRIWLFSRVFHYRKYEEWNDMDRDDIPMEERIKVQQARRKFLRQFFTDELLQISAVVHFLNELTGWAWKVHDNGNDIPEQLLAGGPAHLLKCIKDGFANLDDIWFEHQVMLEDYMSHPISGILEERQTKVPETDSAVYKLILDSVDGGNDPCEQCHLPIGFDLLGPSTYDFVLPTKDSFKLYMFPNLMKGRLGSSVTDQSFLRAQIVSSNGYQLLDFSFLESIFDDAPRQPGFEDWKKEDWLCDVCLEKFLREHLHLWLLQLKIKAGQTIPEDCWYGYNCRTMTHRHAHAAKLNHLCEPTRGV